MHADEDTQAHWLVVARSVRGPTAAVAQYHKKNGNRSSKQQTAVIHSSRKQCHHLMLLEREESSRHSKEQVESHYLFVYIQIDSVLQINPGVHTIWRVLPQKHVHVKLQAKEFFVLYFFI